MAEIDNTKPLYTLTVGEYIELNKKIIFEAQENFARENSEEPKDLIGIKDACEFLNLAKQTIYGLVNANKIPYIKKEGHKKLYFSRKELLNWINGRKEVTNE